MTKTEKNTAKAHFHALEAAMAQPEQPTALRGTDAQILKERELTASAIHGAMAYGYQNGEYPPDDSAWLRPFWEIGRRDAEREKLISAQPAATDWNSLTDIDRQQVFESLPDMLEGFLKTWGWLHFAKGIESKCREKNTAQAVL